MSLIGILKKTTLYKKYEEHNFKKNKAIKEARSKYFKTEAEEMLKQISLALNSKDIVFWLEFGTLLGYHREHDFIKHDFDLDFGVYLEDAKKVRGALLANGFEIIYEYEASDGGREECYKYKHTTVDIFYFRKNENCLYCNTFTAKSNLGFFGLVTKFKCLVKRIEIPNSGFVKTTYKNVEVYIPGDVEKHLIMHYGPYYMTPNPNFDYKKEATNITWHDYKDVQGILRVLKKVRFV